MSFLFGGQQSQPMAPPPPPAPPPTPQSPQVNQAGKQAGIRAGAAAAASDVVATSPWGIPQQASTTMKTALGA